MDWARIRFRDKNNDSIMTAELYLGHCDLIECIEIGMTVAKWIAQKVEMLEEGARCRMASNEAVKK
jgi:hypothetical protein